MPRRDRPARRILASLLLMLSGAVLSPLGVARAEDGAVPGWPDDLAGRTAVLTLLQSLNDDLLHHDSATLTIERWCARYHLAPDPKIHAELIRGQDKPAPPEVRARLQVGAEEPVRYRRVHLVCGRQVLSQADNWYVPGRLTAEMNRLLDETDTPFGKAVAALGFSRKTLSARLLWSPLPERSEGAATQGSGKGTLVLPPEVLEHRALLVQRDSLPFSEVVETYSSAVLAFPPPHP